MKTVTYIFKFLIIVISSTPYLSSYAQETVCGGDGGCNAYHMVIAKNTTAGCQQSYAISIDNYDDDAYISISVEGADFSFNGQHYIDGQWVNIYTETTETKYCYEDGQYKTFFVTEGSVTVAHNNHPYSIKIHRIRGSILLKECTLYEPNSNPCFYINDLCVYKNAGGSLKAFVNPNSQYAGYDYQWQKWNTETATWQLVSSGTSSANSVELPIAAEFAYRSDRYRLRLRYLGSGSWLNSSSAYVRYYPQNCSFVVP